MATSVELSEAIAEKREFSIRTERIEKLVKKLDDCGNPELRAIALELVQSVVELHGAALARMLESVSQTQPGEHALGRSYRRRPGSERTVAPRSAS